MGARGSQVYHVQARLWAMLMINFLLTSLIMCFVAFLLSNGTLQAGARSFLIPYFLVTASEVFLYCYFGQQLIDSKHAAVDGIYESGWENIEDNELKKRFSLIIQQAANPTHLSAMGFADVSLTTFAAVCKLK